MKGARFAFPFALTCACAASLILGLNAFAAPLRQANTRVSLTVDAGFNSYSKPTTWLPLRVTLVNSGDPIDGQVIVANVRPGVNERYVQPVTLGRNARRQVTLYAPPGGEAYDVRLESGGEVIAAVTPVVRQLAQSDRLVLIASDPPDAYNFIGDVRAANGSTSALALLRTDQFPDRSFALDAADVIVLDKVDTGSMTRAQRDAIRQWVVGGGHLILSGGPNAQLALGGFEDFAPGRIGQTLVDASAEALGALAAPASLAPLAPAPTQTMNAVRLESTMPNVRALAGSAETPLILRREVGRGLVDQLAFDPALAPLRDWPGRAALFTALLGGRTEVASALGVLGENDNDATLGASALAAASPPSALVVGGFFALYVLAIGPLNFLLLRRMRKQQWAWLTVPAIVIAFTVLGLLTGFRLRGNNAQVHRLSLSVGDAAAAEARNFATFGLFSPRRADVDFSVGRGLAQNIGDAQAPAEMEQPVITVFTGDPGVVADLPLTNSEVRTVYARDGAGDGPRVGATLRFIPGSSNTIAAVGGQVRNDSAFDLKGCSLIVGKDYQAIGDLAAGGSAEVKVNLVGGHAQSLLNLRNINASRDRITFGAARGATSRGARPSSSSAGAARPNQNSFPFEQNGPPIQDALVNWQTFSDEPVRQEALNAVVGAVFGVESPGSGAYVGCWEPRDMTGASVFGADYTDRTVHVWRVPVEGHLIEPGQALPPDVFTWNVITTNSSSEPNDSGLALEPGDHIIALTPWLDLRTTQADATVALNLEFDSTNSSLPGLRDTTVALYNWQTRTFDPAIENADDTAAQNTHTGPYLSPAGQVVIKVSPASESVTLSRVATSVEMPK